MIAQFHKTINTPSCCGILTQIHQTLFFSSKHAAIFGFSVLCKYPPDHSNGSVEVLFFLAIVAYHLSTYRLNCVKLLVKSFAPMSVYVGAFRYLCRMWLKTKAKHQYTHQIEEDKKCTQPYGVCKKERQNTRSSWHARSAQAQTCTIVVRTLHVCRLLLNVFRVFFYASRPIGECYLCLSRSMCNYSTKFVRPLRIVYKTKSDTSTSFAADSFEFWKIFHGISSGFFSYTVFSILSNRISKWTVPINGDETNRFQCIYENISVIMWQYTRCFAVNLISYYNVNEPFTYISN